MGIQINLKTYVLNKMWKLAMWEVYPKVNNSSKKRYWNQVANMWNLQVGPLLKQSRINVFKLMISIDCTEFAFCRPCRQFETERSRTKVNSIIVSSFSSILMPGRTYGPTKIVNSHLVNLLPRSGWTEDGRWQRDETLVVTASANIDVALMYDMNWGGGELSKFQFHHILLRSLASPTVNLYRRVRRYYYATTSFASAPFGLKRNGRCLGAAQCCCLRFFFTQFLMKLNV